jgi:hypothetical protein
MQEWFSLPSGFHFQHLNREHYYERYEKNRLAVSGYLWFGVVGRSSIGGNDYSQQRQSRP